MIETVFDYTEKYGKGNVVFENEEGAIYNVLPYVEQKFNIAFMHVVSVGNVNIKEADLFELINSSKWKHVN